MKLNPSLLWLAAWVALGGCAEPGVPHDESATPAPIHLPWHLPPQAPRLSALNVGCTSLSTRVQRPVRCSAQAMDQNGEPMTTAYTWLSSDASLASVSASGWVTPLASGSVTVRASATANSITLTREVSLSIDPAGEPTVHDVSVSSSETWRAEDNPHLVRGPLEVGGASNPTLTLEPGTIVLFAPDAELRVTHGALRASGSVDGPILLRAEQEAASRGSWRGVVLADPSVTSQLDFVQLEQCGATTGEGACLSVRQGGVPVLHHVTVRGSGSAGVQLADDGSAFGAGSMDLSVRDSQEVALRMGANTAGTLPTLGQMTGNGVNAVEVRGTVSDTQTWPAIAIPYLVSGSLYVQGPRAPTLTVAAGNQLTFRSGTGLYVGLDQPGALGVNATGASPVLFTSAEPGALPGAWKGVSLHGQGGSGSRLSNVVIELAGQPLGTEEAASLVIHGAGEDAPLLEDVVLRQGSAVGLLMAGGTPGGLKAGSHGLSIQHMADHPIVLEAEQVQTLPADTSFSENAVGTVAIRASTVLTSQTWPRLGEPYLLEGTVQVGGRADTYGPVLKLLPGTELRFAPEAGLVMGPNGSSGGLSAVGTPEEPILFGPDPDTSSRVPWLGLTFWFAPVSTLSYAVITGGGMPELAAHGNLNVLRELGAFVTHTTLRGSAGCGATLSRGQDSRGSPVLTDFTYPGYHNTFLDNAGGAQCATTP